ncbi:hypothetical protein GCM10009678_46120 [Actinomadura kijaniata]|uniref:Expansin (Peptidoglycan-binding protein) n=1 Tax=Actinomadura namibiensis TaxID=182080 RepID=A0A7W3QR24_ACTNM|nr:expansin EXLX1 family cellulose-binding protein [Actinomadura namibiensis]MBA8955933.1 expansin (peptidoglycan-binding protein) [Actinomadura namibiensis]
MHATPRRGSGRHRLWALLSLAVIAALAFGAVRLQADACAAVPPAGRDPGPAGSGTAVHHRDWSEVLCSLGPLPEDGAYVSLASATFGRAEWCGSYLEVRGPRGAVRAMVVDRCRGCGTGRVGLSEHAFARVAGDAGRGVVAVRWRPLRDPAPAGRLAFRVKPGSSARWLGLLVTGHGNPLARVEVGTPGGWRGLRRGGDNHWVGTGVGGGPFTVRVADRHGRRAVVRGVGLRPGAVQRTRTRLYDHPRPPRARPSPSPIPPATPARPTPPPRPTPREHTPPPLARTTPTTPPTSPCR